MKYGFYFGLLWSKLKLSHQKLCKSVNSTVIHPVVIILGALLPSLLISRFPAFWISENSTKETVLLTPISVKL